jgi:hypothetical protein
MMAEMKTRRRMVFLTVHRGPAPRACAMGCPEHRSIDICRECYRRPIKGIDRSEMEVD